MKKFSQEINIYIYSDVYTLFFLTMYMTLVHTHAWGSLGWLSQELLATLLASLLACSRQSLNPCCYFSHFNKVTHDRSSKCFSWGCGCETTSSSYRLACRSTLPSTYRPSRPFRPLCPVRLKMNPCNCVFKKVGGGVDCFMLVSSKDKGWWLDIQSKSLLRINTKVKRRQTMLYIDAIKIHSLLSNIIHLIKYI